MPLKKKTICPLMQSECIEDGTEVNGEIHACRFWIKVAGKNPQTGAPIEAFDCSIAWLPMLLIENTQATRSGAAATESFRNEMAANGERNATIVARALGVMATRTPRLLQPEPAKSLSHEITES